MKAWRRRQKGVLGKHRCSPKAKEYKEEESGEESRKQSGRIEGKIEVVKMGRKSQDVRSSPE